jgi:L-amino acid N-acyltransferase YncA
VLIRTADPDRDAPAIAAIYAPYVTDSIASFEEWPPSADEMARRIEHITARYPWLVAERDGVVVGYAYGSQHHERAAYRWAADTTVYIDPAHHREGLGRALYGELLPLLGTQGIQVVFAVVGLPNDASVALHESLGFEAVGIYRGVGYKRGQWHDVGWWQRDLKRPRDNPPPELTPPTVR